MASVRKRKWTHNGVEKEAWVVAYTDQSGKRRLKTFDKKKDADRYRTQVESEIEAGLHIAPAESISIGKLLDAFVDHARARHKDGRSMGKARLQIIENQIRKHIRPYFAEKTATALNWANVDDWLNTLTANPRLNAVTIKTIASVFKMAIDYGMKRGYVARNIVSDVMRGRQRIQHREIRTFTREEVALLLQEVENYPSDKRRCERSRLKRWLFVHLAAFCGLRCGEICGLTWQNIDFEESVIMVRHNMTKFGEHKAPKTKAGIRDVPLPRHIAVKLRDMEMIAVPNEQGLVFFTRNGGYENAANFHSSYWKPLLEAVGLDDNHPLGRHHFHALRHFAASMMIETGVPLTDAAAILGHRTFDETLQTYAHPLVGGRKRQELFQSMATSMLTRPNQQIIDANATTARQDAVRH